MLNFPKLLVNNVKALTASPLPNQANCLLQQTRNTYVLKRKNEAMLHKKNERPHRFRKRHFIYELVEHVNLKKMKPLDLILTKFVTGLGNVGTKISMSPNRAYNLLLLPKLADYATPENIEKYTKLSMTEIAQAPFSSVSVEKTMKQLSFKRIAVTMSKSVPWTLEKWHIRANFRKAGIVLSEDVITMPEKPISGPNLDMEGKEFYVTVTINDREQVKVRCCIHHWASEKVEQIVVPEFWKLSSEPIFPEDKAVLDSLPSPWKEK